MLMNEHYVTYVVEALWISTHFEDFYSEKLRNPGMGIVTQHSKQSQHSTSSIRKQYDNNTSQSGNLNIFVWTVPSGPGKFLNQFLLVFRFHSTWTASAANVRICFDADFEELWESCYSTWLRLSSIASNKPQTRASNYGRSHTRPVSSWPWSSFEHIKIYKIECY